MKAGPFASSINLHPQTFKNWLQKSLPEVLNDSSNSDSLSSILYVFNMERELLLSCKSSYKIDSKLTAEESLCLDYKGY